MKGWPVDNLRPKDRDIYLANGKGEYAAYTPEMLLAKGLCRWQGWVCAAGVENLCVSPEGVCWSATCKVGGEIGQIYQGKIETPGRWIRCTKEVCSCGSDMEIRKARTEEYSDLTYRIPPEEFVEDLSSNADFAGSVHYREGKKDVNITWDLSRRCNYQCNYCPPEVSNQTDPLHTKEKLFEGYEVVKRDFIKGRTAKFVFTGGEPTLHSCYMDLIKQIYIDGHEVHTQSNGFRAPEYYASLNFYGLVGLSIHMPFAKTDHIAKVLREVISAKKRDRQTRYNWFGVRVMVPPGHLEEAKMWRDHLRKVRGIKKFMFVVFSPVYEPGDTNRLQEYNSGELEELVNLWK